MAGQRLFFVCQHCGATVSPWWRWRHEAPKRDPWAKDQDLRPLCMREAA